MPNCKGSVLFVLILTLVLTDTLIAQEKISLNKDHKFSILAGYSPISIKFFGKTPNTQTSISQVRYQKKTKYSYKKLPIYYQVSISPYIYYDYEKRDDGGKKDIASGFGFSPIGFATFYELNRHIDFQLSTSGGFMIMNQDFPTDKGQQLNFTYELEPSLVIRNNHFFSFAAGYKFHHISNAQTGTENPGVDSNFIFFSIILSS
ncbi:MAG: acyloxyacyl hydrolase [Balneola sp.]|nr:MAG: acyloxyacyl hydrolase [Balneola sp.]